ncbi:MAG: GAF domain-containing protein [Methyloligellaceae bacterium]
MADLPDLPKELISQVREQLDAGHAASKEALTSLLDSAVGQLSAAESSVLTPKDTDELGFQGSTNAALTGENAPRVPIRASIAGYVFLTGQTIATDDAAASPDHNKSVDEQTGMTTKEYLAAPIVRGETIGGVLTFVNRSAAGKGAFSQDEIALAEKYADLCALVLDHIEKVRRQTDVTEKALRSGFDPDHATQSGFLLGSSGLLSDEVDPLTLRAQIDTGLDELAENDLELVREIVNRLASEGSGDAV